MSLPADQMGEVAMRELESLRGHSGRIWAPPRLSDGLCYLACHHP